MNREAGGVRGEGSEQLVPFIVFLCLAIDWTGSDTKIDTEIILREVNHCTAGLGRL